MPHITISCTISLQVVSVLFSNIHCHSHLYTWKISINPWFTSYKLSSYDLDSFPTWKRGWGSFRCLIWGILGQSEPQGPQSWFPVMEQTTNCLLKSPGGVWILGKIDYESSRSYCSCKLCQDVWVFKYWGGNLIMTTGPTKRSILNHPSPIASHSKLWSDMVCVVSQGEECMGVSDLKAGMCSGWRRNLWSSC